MLFMVKAAPKHMQSGARASSTRRRWRRIGH